MPDKLAAKPRRKPARRRCGEGGGAGDSTWITNPFTREFQKAPGNASILDIINPAALVDAVASDIKTRAGRPATIDGKAAITSRARSRQTPCRKDASPTPPHCGSGLGRQERLPAAPGEAQGSLTPMSRPKSPA
jgi:hypothetical protein